MYRIGSIKAIDSIIAKTSDTKPPSLNQSVYAILTIIGTIDVLINLAIVSLKATDKLYVV